MARKEITAKQSIEILKRIVGDETEFLGINWANHTKSPLRKNLYKLTIEILSLETLIKLLEHERIKNVYFHPSVPPPGSGKDLLAMRYRLYVEYN